MRFVGEVAVSAQFPGNIDAGDTLERTSCFLDRMKGAPKFNPRVRDGPSREGAYSMALRLNVCGYGTYLCGEIAF